jgi:hypothetical protein
VGFAQRVGKPIIFTEVGYRSVDNAHSAPWDWRMGGGYNGTEQANDYDALMGYWDHYAYFAGVYWWDWQSNPNAGGSGDVSYTPQNKPAQQIMQKWFTNAVPPSNPPPNNTPPPQSGPVSTDIWWPSDGAKVAGLQPFKAMLQNVDVSNYQMYWQVDGGQLNLMNNNSQDWPHKESPVDLSGWHWQSTGLYTITFVSKNQSGSIISQRSVHIVVP